MSGMFVVFDGFEGAGKSTQIRLTEKWLTELGFSVNTTYEPGDTEVGQQLRSILLNPNNKIPDLAELMIYIADRIIHVEQKIIPALEAEQVVLCDRYSFSTLAYQGHGRGIDLETIHWLNSLSTKGIQPNFTLYFDIDPEVGIARKDGNLDRLEKEDNAFHQRVRRGYRQLAANHAVFTIDAKLSKEEMHEIVKSIFNEFFLVSSDICINKKFNY